MQLGWFLGWTSYFERLAVLIDRLTFHLFQHDIELAVNATIHFDSESIILYVVHLISDQYVQ